jgi:hypothetical protein
MGQRLSFVVVKKNRQPNCDRLGYPKKMLPTSYQTHLQKQLIQAQFMLITILVGLIQSEKQVRLELLPRVFPYPITAESLAKQATQISGPTSINDFTNFPLITYWLTTYCSVGQKLSIAIARRRQGVYQSLHRNFVQ